MVFAYRYYVCNFYVNFKLIIMTINKTYIYLSLFLACIITSCNPDNQEKKRMEAPDAKKEPYELSAHGKTRTDNYYWMRLSDEQKNAENPDAQTQEVKAYLQAENEYLEHMMAHTKDLQDTIFEEMTSRLKKDDSSVPYLKNGYWYYRRYEGETEYPLYCRKKGSLDAPEEILLNVNELAEGFDYYHVTGLNISPDGTILSFGVDTLSRRIYTIHFKNLATGEILSDQIPNTSGNVAWASDNQMVFYTLKNEVTLLTEKVFKHRLGDDISNDQEVYAESDQSFYMEVYNSKSEAYVVIGLQSTTTNDYWLLPANQPNGKFEQFTAREEGLEYQMDHFQDQFIILTNWEAQNFRLMQTNIADTRKDNWQEVIPHRENVFLENFELFNDHWVLEERSQGLTQLRVINQKSQQDHYISFQEPAYVLSIGTNPQLASDTLRFIYSSLTTPASTYDYHMDTKERVLKKQEEVVGGHNPEAYITERLFAPARDGKQIPISIVYKKGFEKNGQNPLLLYGYGSYGHTIDPYFTSDKLSLLDRGFAYAIAHIRGGQMLGRAWYEDGKMQQKKNTFYDFIDCGKYLLKEGYAAPDKLFARGGSAGGLLMGAVINLEPTLFEGVVAAVPFVDVITTMSDPSIPLTTNEYDEWGNPEANQNEYEYIASYSPYDNIVEQSYPNLLITTGFFDSQVQYWEPAKWIAKLRDYHQGDNTLMMHTNMEAGHSGSSGRFRRYKDLALAYAFFLDLANK